MKYVLVIPDGAADEPQDDLDGLTPLQAANIPNMDAVVQQGCVGQTDNVPPSMPSGSDVGTMSLFGYDPLKFHTGRAPLEAAAQGIELNTDDWAVRCNLVTIQNEMMASFTAEQISNELGAHLIGLMQEVVADDPRWTFFPGVSYRNLLIYNGTPGQSAPFDSTTSTCPPHDLTDQTVVNDLPAGLGSELLLDLMNRSKELFAKDELNQSRTQDNQQPASNIWLWGQGSRPSLQPFKERYGVDGAVITAVDLLRGIGKLIGWDVVEVPGATGYLDTDYAAKGQYAIDTLKSGKDFVVVHVEASDEASHEGETQEKIKAFERIDQDIVAPVHEYLKSQGDYRILISPDHPTFLRTKTHSHGYVPYAIAGNGVEADDQTTYSEVTAKTGKTFDEGHLLMGHFFSS